MRQFQTDKNDITKHRLVEIADTPQLGADEILVDIERFAFTANNVTYGAIGHMIGYWQFFPPQLTAQDDTDWGLIPVWGFARVSQSNHAEIAEGERLYGYFPIATGLKMKAGKVTQERVVDVADHRADLPPVYNNYNRLGMAAGDSIDDALQALLMPLFVTSFCLCDALEDADYHGADQVVVLSASSKTAIGLAYGLTQIDGPKRPKIVGLTSPNNAAFVKGLGLYDQTISYDALDALDTKRASVLVDMSGNRAVMGAVHAALGENMRWCHNVGLTHWDDSETGKDPNAAKLIRERSAMFFAPGHIQKRHADWGAAGYNAKVDAFMAGATAHARGWMKIKQTDGLEDFKPLYDTVVAGHISPVEGLIVAPK